MVRIVIALSAVSVAGCLPCPGQVGYFGQVIDRQTEKPIEGAEVTIVRHDKLTGRHEVGPSTKTDGKGRFKVEYHYSVTVERPHEGIFLRIQRDGYVRFQESPFVYNMDYSL